MVEGLELRAVALGLYALSLGRFRNRVHLVQNPNP